MVSGGFTVWVSHKNAKYLLTGFFAKKKWQILILYVWYYLTQFSFFVLLFTDFMLLCQSFTVQSRLSCEWLGWPCLLDSHSLPAVTPCVFTLQYWATWQNFNTFYLICSNVARTGWAWATPKIYSGSMRVKYLCTQAQRREYQSKQVEWLLDQIYGAFWK